MKVQLNDAFFNRLETMSLNLKSNLRGYFGGKHLVSTYGQTVEFADYREYQLGDDIRRIDWNLFSRFEKYFLKLFTDERQMQVQIFLDCSASMGREFSDKASYAIAAAAALGFLAVQEMDKLSLYLMNGTSAVNPYGLIVGKNSFFRAVSAFDGIEFQDEVDMESCITNCPDTSTNNGLSVIISDFCTDQWKKAVDFLLYKHRQVLLLQVLSPEELDPTYEGRVTLIDAESVSPEDSKNMKLRITRSMLKAYEEAMRDFKEDIRTFCSRRDVGFLSVSCDMPIERVLFGELLKAGIME